MVNSLVPPYLSNLVPTSVGSETPYGLRNSENIRNVHCKSQLFSNSFLPSTINAWNNLAPDVRNSSTLSSFKHALNRDITKVPSYYYTGSREVSIQHARLRMHCSSLKEHLFSKNIIESPLCTCGEIEDTKHFLLACPIYTNQRTTMLNNLSNITPITENILLFGNESLDSDKNETIFKHVQGFITHTQRFKR